jgi:hypothetical protein
MPDQTELPSPLFLRIATMKSEVQGSERDRFTAFNSIHVYNGCPPPTPTSSTKYHLSTPTPTLKKHPHHQQQHLNAKHNEHLLRLPLPAPRRQQRRRHPWRLFLPSQEQQQQQNDTLSFQQPPTAIDVPKYLRAFARAVRRHDSRARPERSKIREHPTSYNAASGLAECPVVVVSRSAERASGLCVLGGDEGGVISEGNWLVDWTA